MYSYTFFIALFYAIPFKTPRRKRPCSTFVGFSYNAHAHQLQLCVHDTAICLQTKFFENCSHCKKSTATRGDKLSDPQIAHLEDFIAVNLYPDLVRLSLLGDYMQLMLLLQR